MSYIGIPPFGNTVRSVTNVTATASQTTFNITGGYVIGYVDVFLNGVLLTPSDYTATDGLTVVLNTGASASDEFQAVSYQPVSIANVLPITGGTVSGDVTIASGNTLKTNTILDASGGNTVTINSVTPTAYNTMGKNLIINGAMEIAQRGTSATISTAQSYKTVDRIKATGGFGGYTNTESQDTSVVPEGFTTSYKWANTASAGAISSGAYNVIDYKVEGYSMSHLDWGKSSAKTVTLSFYVRSGVTGTYGIGLLNGTSNVYMTTYTVNSADTWERKTIVIPGPTVGSWNTTTSTGLTIRWDMGVGTTYSTSTTEDWTLSGNIWGYTGGVKFVETNNVDFYLTGVQLEVGSVATEFERRPYGTELALCQRYYERTNSNNDMIWTGDVTSTQNYYLTGLFMVQKRANPTFTATIDSTSGFGTTVADSGANTNCWNFGATCNSTGARRYFTGGFTASAEL